MRYTWHYSFEEGWEESRHEIGRWRRNAIGCNQCKYAMNLGRRKKRSRGSVA